MLIGSVRAGLSTECKPSHFRAPYFIKSMGVCAFDAETLSYAGAPVEQAMCLMRGMDFDQKSWAAVDRPASSASQPNWQNY